MSTPVVVLDRGNNTTCTINLHGCTIVSWRVNNQVNCYSFLILTAVNYGPEAVNAAKEVADIEKALLLRFCGILLYRKVCTLKLRSGPQQIKNCISSYFNI